MIQTINISLIPSDNKPVINVSQYDNGLRVLRFNVFDDIEMEVPHEFDGETVTCNIRKNDNNIVVITGTIETETTEEVETSFVQVVLTEQACACVGSNYGEISLSSGDDVIGTCNFKLVVERSPLAGGVDSQSEIDNLTTQIESIAEQVIGDDYYNKTEVDGLIDGVESEIPTKTSQLTNDSGFITAEDIPTIPTKTSQLTNDSGFITAEDIPTIPTKTSQLTNDSGFITANDIPTIPTKTSQLTNDSGFITAEDIPTIPTKTSQLTNDSGFITANDIPTIPTKTSQLTNDSGFTTIDDDATKNNKTWSSEKISDELYALLPVGTARGSVASFNTALAKPLVSCVVDVNATKLINTNDTNISKYLMGLITGTYGYYQITGEERITTTASGGHVLSTSVPIYTNIKKQAITIEKANIISSFCDTKTYASLNVSGDTDGIGVGPTYVIIGSEQYNNWSDYVGKHILYELDTPVTPTITPELFSAICNEYNITYREYVLPLIEMPITYVGDNNFFTDYGDTTVQYKDTVNNYIDTRVNAVSSRSLSMMRTLETLEKSTTLERGETDDQR